MWDVKNLPSDLNPGNMILFLNVGFDVFFIYFFAINLIGSFDPALIVTESGMYFPKHIVRGHNLITWDEIKGFGYKCGGLLKMKRMVLFLHGPIERNAKSEQIILYGFLRDGDRASSLIEGRIGENRETAPAKSEDKNLPFSVTYRGMVFDSEGIHKRSKHIMWEHVEDVYYRNDSIAGYSVFELRYIDEGGTRRIMKSTPTASQKYLDIMRMIVAYTTNARIDPIMKEAIAYPLKEAKRDETVSLIAGLGVVISAVVLFFKSVIQNYEAGVTWQVTIPPIALASVGVYLIIGKKLKHRVLISMAYLAIVILVTWKIKF